MHSEDAHAWKLPRGHRLGDAQADGVVAAEFVAVADHQDVVGGTQSRVTRSITAPSAATSSTLIAMRPASWVEQLRHGS